MQKFIDEHSECPHICLGAVDVLDESLGRHVDGRADVDVFELGLSQFGEPKIGQFGLSVVDEDVGYLEVPVYNVIVCEIDESLEDILDVRMSLMFLKGSFGAYFAFQVALVAEFGDDVAIAVAGEDLMAAKHIGVIQFLEDINFGEEEFFEFLALEGVELDDLDGDGLPCMTKQLLVSSWCALYTFEKLPWPSRSLKLKM